MPNSKEGLDEPISVGAVFDKVIKPVWFKWSGRMHRIDKITYRWKDRVGDEIRHYFSIEIEGVIYQIYFSDRELIWRMDKVWTE